MKIQIKKLNANAIIPTRGSDRAAGYDLYACLEQDVIIGAGETVKICETDKPNIKITTPEDLQVAAAILKL